MTMACGASFAAARRRAYKLCGWRGLPRKGKQERM